MVSKYAYCTGFALAFILLASYAQAQTVTITNSASWGTVAGATSIELDVQQPGSATFAPFATFGPTITSGIYTITGKSGDAYCIRVQWLNSNDPTQNIMGSPLCSTVTYALVQVAGSTASLVCTGTAGQMVLPSFVQNSGGLNPIVTGQGTSLLYNGKPCQTVGQLCQ